MNSSSKNLFFYQVAVDSVLPGSLTYCYHEEILEGSRVVVPFGRNNRKVLGVILGQGIQPDGVQVKAIAAVSDRDPYFSKVLVKMAQWISSYYMYPIGQVYKSMLPGATKTTRSDRLYLNRENGEVLESDEEKAYFAILESVFGKREFYLAKTAEKKIAAACEAEGVSVKQLIKKMVGKGILLPRLDRKLTLRDSNHNHEARLETAITSQGIELNPEQALALRELQESAGQDSPTPHLLWGVTGAGKTEVYLRLIQSLVEESNDDQILVLVPEISLTPQMTRVFSNRFPNQVAVVHSGLESAERWERLQEIRKRHKRILIGPRSAVFAPFYRLRLIIVDEEHDSSYKQGSGLRYHGRDVAILRGSLEPALVVLGSATPSMETFYNVKSGKFQMSTVLQRANQSPLPQLEVIAQRIEKRRGQSASGALEEAEIPVADEIISALEDNVLEGMQSIVIVNRRGFAYFLFDRVEKKAVECPSCSVSLTVHRQKYFLKCHYCDYTQPLGEYLRAENDQYLVVGYGSEQAEAFLKSRLPTANVVRVDSDTVAKKGELEKILSEFRDGKIDILVGTQILAKGHDFPKVTLICLLEVDQMLNLPDFRAGERTFQLIVQAAGRAGRAENRGRVLLQTNQSQQPAIHAALSQDFELFANGELDFRQRHFFPPLAKMIHFEFNGANRDQLDQFAQHVEVVVRNLMLGGGDVSQVQILGPSIPPIERVRNRWRRTLLFSSPNLSSLRKTARTFQNQLPKIPPAIRMIIDVDPQSII